jgi:rfaE bifunctional protein kinase chain/domain
MNSHHKIISVNELNTDNIVLCYGHFDLIHPGHLRYLQYAKTLANNLVVALMSDKELNGENQKSYLEDERAESVANLQIVDHVIVLNNELTLDCLIDIVKPKVLVLGKEFEQNQSEQINLAVNAVKNHGKIVFHAGETHYFNANLLFKNVVDIEVNSKNQLNKICKNYKITLRDIQKKLSNFSNSELIVIGDTIVDNYVACDAIGMSAEAPVLVVKELENREFIGGAAIVASHVAALGAKCHYISVVGEDDQSNMVSKSLIGQNIGIDLIVDESRPTTYKTRYMVENQKLFRVSRIKDHKISAEIEQKIIDKLTVLAPNIDGILVSDFIYGVITQNILDFIIKLSKQFNIKLYGDLQCSSQAGKVSKFRDFDLITPTEKESRIALDDNESGVEWVATTLLKNTNSKNMLMKLGSDGFIAYSKNLIDRQDFPALSVNPVDVTGAGDSLFAVMSVSLSSGANLIEASVIGTCMASLAVKDIGNTPITNDRLNQYIYEVLH